MGEVVCRDIGAFRGHGWLLYWRGMILVALTDDAALWSAQLDAVPVPVLEQSWSYGAAVAAISRFQPERWLLKNGGGEIIGLTQAFRRDIKPLGSLVRLVRGPLFKNGVPRHERQAAMAALRACYPFRPFAWDGRCLLWWLPELPAGSEADAAMAALGLKQMVTGYHSMRLDLTPALDKLRAQLDGKWRNALKAAEKAPLTINSGWDDAVFEELMHAHDAQRLSKRFLGPDGAFYRAFANQRQGNDGARLFTASAAGRLLAGLLMLRHGLGATYAVGWSSMAGRDLRAHHRLLWEAIAALKAEGVKNLDLGGIDTEGGAGVARFKLGLNGAVFTLAGSYA